MCFGRVGVVIDMCPCKNLFKIVREGRVIFAERVIMLVCCS